MIDSFYKSIAWNFHLIILFEFSDDDEDEGEDNPESDLDDVADEDDS